MIKRKTNSREYRISSKRKQIVSRDGSLDTISRWFQESISALTGISLAAFFFTIAYLDAFSIPETPTLSESVSFVSRVVLPPGEAVAGLLVLFAIGWFMILIFNKPEFNKNLQKIKFLNDLLKGIQKFVDDNKILLKLIFWLIVLPSLLEYDINLKLLSAYPSLIVVFLLISLVIVEQLIGFKVLKNFFKCVQKFFKDFEVVLSLSFSVLVLLFLPVVASEILPHFPSLGLVLLLVSPAIAVKLLELFVIRAVGVVSTMLIISAAASLLLYRINAAPKKLFDNGLKFSTARPGISNASLESDPMPVLWRSNSATYFLRCDVPKYVIGIPNDQTKGEPSFVTEVDAHLVTAICSDDTVRE